MNETITCEVLIIGSGIAGCATALELADAGVPVLMITRAAEPTDSNSSWAQGGIIYTSDEDSPPLLTKDILHAGAGHTFPPAAEILAKEGPGVVSDMLLERVGVPFDKNGAGRLEAIKEAAHSAPRIIHVADRTGKAIMVAFLNKLKKHPNVTLLTGHTAIDLITPSHHAIDRLRVYEPRTCLGAYVFDQSNGSVKGILASRTVLATGGLGQIYMRTTNPKGARGDGVAMAYRAGARVINMEYVQFHPTTFHKEGAPHFLISEAVRGAGGRLVHTDGEPFMQKYDPEWKDLAPRDVVSHSIHQEMLEREIPNVFLDFASKISREEILRRFPSIYEQCLTHGVDITTEPAPVVPGAHYACGGVWVDMAGQTTIDNLFAVGEVACTGLHGANRLASTSLLEGVVWGKRVACSIADARRLGHLDEIDAADIPTWNDSNLVEADPVLIAQDMYTIQQTMWHYVGLARTTARLKRALRELRHLETEIEDFYRQAKLTDSLIGLRNGVRTALIVTAAAWSNRRSLGCHYRES